MQPSILPMRKPSGSDSIQHEIQHETHHSELFADKKNHINGIKNFWSQAKPNMRKYNGIKLGNFHWFLKVYEWRFNGDNPQ